jgi:Yippee zinc-binding/DNA-binding /Mis18, centromere assembly
MDQQSQSHEEEEDHPVYPQARHHTYLPGAIHPLGAAETPRDELRHTLAVLEWPDSVVFPGMVIPIRFSDPDWVAYLQQQILQNTITSSHPVRFGLLMVEGRRSLPRRSWARQGQGPAALRRWSQQLIEELAHAADDDDDDLFDSALVSVPPGRVVRIRSGRLDEAEDRRPADPFVGRIGTVVTVLYRHGPDVVPGRAASPLIVTAVGTGRFRIVGYRSPAEQDAYGRLDRRNVLKYFRMEELWDRPWQLPSRTHFAGGGVPKEGRGYEAQRRHLALVSPYPSWVVNQLWPWKLVASILVALQNLPSLEGLLQVAPLPPRGSVLVHDSNSPPSPTDNPPSFLQEPVAFSFWLAANLPFQNAEKLEILQMISVVERLTYFYEKVQHFVLNEAAISCMDCSSLISSSFQMFTLEGAEGTTGHYVNEHGVIHQTITLREVNAGSVHFDSSAHVQDSWFPGYNWTIMSCSACAHHLGWKFCSVEGPPAPSPGVRPTCASSTGSSNRRPSVFYGISAANVDIYVPIRRSRWVSVSDSP